MDLPGKPFFFFAYGNADLILGAAGNENDFEEGALDLFATYRLGEHWSFLSELVLESNGEEVVLDPERYIAAYRHSELFQVELGRMHNGLVDWNVEQHHGLYLQTTLSKPLLSEWEDDAGLWPVHLVGVRVSGTARQLAGLRYEVSISNGRGETLDEIQLSDANSEKAVGLSLGVAPESWGGFILKASGYFDDIPAPTGTLQEQAGALAARYVGAGLELRAEWSRLDHEDEVSGERYLTTGIYGLLSYGFMRQTRELRPYLLYDRLSVDETNPYFPAAEDAEALSFGVRWDALERIAFKGELRSEKAADRKREETLRVQVAFGF